MNWQDEQFVKVYTRDTGEWTLLSWDAQALLLQILRKVDRSGVLQLGKHGVRVLPAALGHREQAERITAALAELTADGCVVLRPECLVVPNFIAAQTSRQSDKARQQSARDRRRAESMGASLPADKETSQNVTDCHLESPGVTTSHLASPRVTLDKNRIEEIRSEEKRQEQIHTSGVAAQPDVASRHRAADKALEREAARIAKDAAKAADRAAKEQAKREAKEAREKERAAAKENAAAATRSYGSTLFQSYRAAFARRYQTEPLRDARTNAHFARIAKRTIEGRPADISPEAAIEEASRVCAAYLWSAVPQYVQSNHAPGLLERDWHKLLTEHRTGRQITPQLANKSAADLKREAEIDAYFARQDRKHDAIEVASEEEGRRDF